MKDITYCKVVLKLTVFCKIKRTYLKLYHYYIKYKNVTKLENNIKTRIYNKYLPELYFYFV